MVYESLRLVLKYIIQIWATGDRNMIVQVSTQLHIGFKYLINRYIKFNSIKYPEGFIASPCYHPLLTGRNPYEKRTSFELHRALPDSTVNTKVGDFDRATKLRASGPGGGFCLLLYFPARALSPNIYIINKYAHLLTLNSYLLRYCVSLELQLSSDCIAPALYKCTCCRQYCLILKLRE